MTSTALYHNALRDSNYACAKQKLVAFVIVNMQHHVMFLDVLTMFIAVACASSSKEGNIFTTVCYNFKYKRVGSW